MMRRTPICLGLRFTVAMTALGVVAGIAQADEAIATGPAVGSKIPGFTLKDQAGKSRSFADLRGRKGLLILFYRTADW